jgi:pimeloyl-ACP methyl ester carboxylesterase
MTGVVPAARGEQVVQADATTLTEALLFSEDACTDHACTAATVNKDGVLTHCGGTGVCPHSPSIIMHGIGQSEPICSTTTATVSTVPTDARYRLADFCGYGRADKQTRVAGVENTHHTKRQRSFRLGGGSRQRNFCRQRDGPRRQPINNVELVRYPYSVARCTPQEKNFIYSSMRLTNYTEIAGEDHLYYFAYSSFGNNLEIAEELYEYIQQVKRETGHDKVNLVPVSLGGTIANTLLEYYPQVYTDLNRVLYIVPALDGSSIVGDIYTDNLSLSDDMLYNKLAPSLLEGGYLGYVINIAMRLLPKEVLRAVLDKAIDSLFESALLNCTVMWSLVPSWAYPEAAAKHLSEPEQAEIKRQTDLYYQAQRNSRANILKLVESGVDVLNIVDYNQMLYAIAGSYDELNADGVIHLDSTSMGATSGYIDTPLPEGYVQQDTYCTHPGQHNHISPDGIVDASTGILPESTWYFRNQHHEGTGRNDVSSNSRRNCC